MTNRAARLTLLLPLMLALQPSARAVAPELPAACTRPLPAPSSLPLDQYEVVLGEFLAARCYLHLGWRMDKNVRDTGPYAATLDGADWMGHGMGTHPAVLMSYSPEALAWVRAREALPEGAAAPEMPDGAMIVKEMYDAPAAQYAGKGPGDLNPTMWTVMVKDSEASWDGWFWGYFGTQGWTVDWPPPENFPYPNMGFGLYCLNCHASAASETTFASLRNVEGEPGHPITFLSQYLPRTLARPAAEDAPDHHAEVSAGRDAVDRVSQPSVRYRGEFTSRFPTPGLSRPDWESVERMPPEPYDHAFSGPDGPDHFLTSDQCLGCHDAGSTGLRFDMTVQPAEGGPLVNLSPYAEWRASPMGMAGRDPIFLSQLESERRLHAPYEAVIQDTCLHCHGVMGQRSYCMDQVADDTVCDSAPPFFDPPTDRKLFDRAALDAVPYQADADELAMSHYGGLARDGISCMVCHHIEASEQPIAAIATGGFPLGPADRVNGPFSDPKVKPMEHAMGLTPQASTFIKDSRLCGSCHTVRLPVLANDGSPVLGPDGQPKTVYEQATYPEWAFSTYADDGATPESCQACHMRGRIDGLDEDLSFRIASIEEASTFPEADHRLPPEDIDLPYRDGYARHTLLGLNLFFIKMNQQFPDIMGIRTQSAMLVSSGIAPLATAERSLVAQARSRTARVSVGEVAWVDDPRGKAAGRWLRADVSVESLVGHKFPSGVGFRRAFLAWEVLDADGGVLWASGRTDDTGVIVDAKGQPVDGELFRRDDCSEVPVGEQRFQPHHQEIWRQDQVQVYQEIVTDSDGGVTTSFLSIVDHAKDNRLLPRGWDPTPRRATAVGDVGLAKDVQPHGVGKDPDYRKGGGDRLTYWVAAGELSREPAAVRATLYYQATPPYYLQDRFCIAPDGPDTQRLYFIAGHLNLDGSAAEDWKLEVVSSGAVPVPR